MAGEWYRSPDWSEEAREEFERRLKRARPESRPQYLHLKARALRAHGGRVERRAARELNERVLRDYPDAFPFDLYRCLTELADIAEEEGAREEAIGHFRTAVSLADQGGVGGDAHLRLAELLVASDDPERWNEAAVVLDKADDLAFSMWRFRYAVLRARLAARAADHLTSAAFARTALTEATRERPDFSRHPEVGWAEADPETLAEMQQLADGMTPDQFLAWQEDQWRAAPSYQDEAPILEDLWSAGIRVSSVWELTELHPAALPVLLAHLEKGGYPDAVMEGLGRQLAVKASAPQWNVLAKLYVEARNPGEKDGLAIALSAAATPEHFDALVELLRDEKHGESRIFLVKTVKRLRRQRGKEILATLTDDPVIGREVRTVLKLK